MTRLVEVMTLDALITQLKKLRSADTGLGEAVVRVSCGDCHCGHVVAGVRPGMWNDWAMVELGTE